jgi:integrase/recombinase XerD
MTEIDFKNYLAAKGYAPEHYKRIRPFLTWVSSNNINATSISLQECHSFLNSLPSKNNGSINVSIGIIKLYFKMLRDMNLMTEAACEALTIKLKLRKTSQKIKDYITKEELNDLIEMGQSFVEYMPAGKISAILYFLFYTGIRKGELLRLQRDDIDLNRCTVKVRVPTKNKQERIVFFPKRIAPTKGHHAVDLVKLLADYFASEGEEDNAFNLTENRLRDLIKNLKDFVPKKNLTIHTFRHSFARMLAAQQIDSRIAQKLLGHKDIKSTMIYYDPDIDIVQNIYKEKVK